MFSPCHITNATMVNAGLFFFCFGSVLVYHFVLYIKDLDLLLLLTDQLKFPFGPTSHLYSLVEIPDRVLGTVLGI